MYSWKSFATATFPMLLSTAAIADSIPPNFVGLTYISRDEIASAIRQGASIEGRAIWADDLLATLNELITSDKQCDRHQALKVERSIINGTLKLGMEKNSDKASAEPSRWISIPVEIKSSLVAGPLVLSEIGVSCRFDLSNSTFNENVLINDASFASDLNAFDTTFKKGINTRNSHLAGTVTFARAQISGVATFAFSKFAAAINFDEANFHTASGFLGSTFDGTVSFREAKFGGVAQFSASKFKDSPENDRGPIENRGPFFMAEFLGEGIFRELKFGELVFFRTSFRDGADFHKAEGRKLYFQNASTKGQVSIDDAKVDEFGLYGAFGPTRIDGEISFRRSSIAKLHFDRVTFKQAVDFQETTFKSKLDLLQVSFKDDVRLEGSKLPPPSTDSAGKQIPPLVFNDVTIDKGLFVDAEQWFVETPWWAFWKTNEPRVYAADVLGRDDPEQKDIAKQRRFWRELVHSFALAGNLQLKNDAEYRVRQMAEPYQPQPQRLLSVLSRWFWGYSLRPERVLVWLVLFLFAFAVLYRTQINQNDAGKKNAWLDWTPVKNALVFSWRTSLELKFGYEHSGTNVFRAITILQSISAKILLSCFAYSLTQTSPLLSELVKKLLP